MPPTRTLQAPPAPAATRGPGVRDVLWVLAAVTYVGLVLTLTLSPAPWATEGSQASWGVLNPATWTAADTWAYGSPFEFTLNVLMFLPAGLLASRLGAVRGLLAPLALTVAIEVAQIPMADRISDPRDLVANSVGALLGLAVGLGAHHLASWAGSGRG